RSPLARIRVALELLPKDGEGAARLADIEQDLAELDRLIDDVLTATRLESATVPARMGTVDGDGLRRALAGRARLDPGLAGEEGGGGGKEGAGTTAEGGEMTGDAALLRRAVWNLVENAGKYGAPPIALSARRAGERIEIAVTDAGPGVPVEDRERVFDPFTRL